jgi:hypothetical protein
MPRHRWLLPALAALFLAACAGPGGPLNTSPSPDNAQAGAATNLPWPVKTREHVDLWLHGFAMVSADTTKVPFFKRGYRDELTVLKNGANVTTQLDANRAQLQARLTANPALVNAQFLALYFGSWKELREVADLFLRAEGDPQRANSRELAAAIATLAQYFPTPPDREWLRLFVASLNDESEKFYHGYWVQQQQNRAPVLAAVDSLWQREYRGKLQGFLNGVQRPTGDLILSMPLDGEGRTLTGSGSNNVVVVSFPDRRENAVEALYVFAHEMAGELAGQVVADNTTPAEKRSGVADRLQSAAAVRTGAILLQRAAPQLADGYARYYLRAANVTSAGADAQAGLAATFPIPDAIRTAIERQIEVVLGGI